MRSELKAFLRCAVPNRYWPSHYLRRLVNKKTGLVVQGGVFAGMSIGPSSTSVNRIPHLLGLYERELHPAVRAIIESSPDVIVNIGAAEGYYAVGLARRIPEVCVIAFECSKGRRQLLEKTARENDVRDRVDIRGLCTCEGLRDCISDTDRTVIVCDIEGGEKELLDPARIEGLRQASVLVELHEFVHPGITDLLRARFERTHHIQHIWQEARDVEDFTYRTAVTWWIPDRYIARAVSEQRPEQMSWLWMVPKLGIS